jgi:DNA-binding NtrC family response regulator
VLLLADGPTIRSKDLPEPLHRAAHPAAAAGPAGAPGEPLPTGEAGLKDIIRQKAAALERDLIIKALEETGGNVTKAAKLLQISRKSLQTKMKEFGLRDTHERDAQERDAHDKDDGDEGA